MAKPFVFQEISRRGRVEGFRDSRQSYRARVWFQKTARQVRSVNVNRLMDGTPSRHQTFLKPDDIGHMFAFFYDAKHKDTLPYWDQFPLILPFRVEKDYFLGFNLHYISPYRRAQVLNALYNISEKEGDRVKKLTVSYGLLSSMTRLAPLKSCVKMYLRNHVKSRFMRIRPEEWDMAVMLPMARFAGASPTKVHRDSAKNFMKR